MLVHCCWLTCPNASFLLLADLSGCWLSGMCRVQELEKCLMGLLRLDRAWLPEKAGYSLYLRPFMFSSAFTLGVAPPSRTTLAIIMCPVGSYFSSG